MARVFRIILLICGVLLAAARPTQAQTTNRLILLAPDLTRFPTVSLTFEAYDAQGNFLNDLTQNEVQITENDQPVKVDNLARLQPGLHMIVAFDVAPSMSATVASGPNHFERVKQTILNWAQALPANDVDTYSLVTNAGPQVSRLNDPQKFTQALLAYNPELAKTQSSLSSLTTALDLASDPSQRINSKRAILYVTASLPETSLAGISNLADRASQLGVHISTWLVLATPSDDPSAQALADLAVRTGGQFQVFSGVETLPSPETYFQPLRFLYRASYTSSVRQSGIQRVQLSLARPDFPTPAQQSFTLDLQPPNPFFLAPPTHIQRTWNQDPSLDQPALTPDQVELRTMVEFPDGLRRGLKASRLYVDGKLAFETTTEPFDRLEWSLAGYTTSQQHMIRVEVEDALGFTRSSIEIPVQVDVEAPPVLNLDFIAAQASPYLPYAEIAGAGLVGIAAVLGVLRWRVRRIKPRAKRSPENGRFHLRTAIPVPARLASFANLNAPARLTRLADGFALQSSSFALSQEEARLGSDPRKANCLIESPAVDGLHARIHCSEAGQFIIEDAGSVAGTWVNYEQVPPGGQALEHGDLVHVGRDAYRFELKNPPPARQPTVTTLREDA